ncbi:glycosyltransferase family 4 protein [Pedobacter jejuensis]|uniref:Glycosyltransferase family 1 protein n=1 Tax=Pedobacter jejuensis TaxID=1268550 RepID=A0A3N0BQ57_9SPHI|nr:glycosyltransferase family 4 protein [Pedobacter jejuensis]RNL51121.1 glycosyltransferase family 1 protein [Pedobacter jejuensis]
MQNKRILFLTLYTFSLTGGIEKVCRALIKVFSELVAQKADDNLKFRALSMHDNDVDLRYIDQQNYQYFQGNKFNFGLKAITESLKSDTVIISHINLLVFGWAIKKLKPKIKIILLAHGIEVWKRLASWKTSFLNQHGIKIWAVSNYTAQQLSSTNGISLNQIEVLNNCLDPFFDIPKKFERPAHLLKFYNLNQNQPILLSVCRLSSTEQYKGYDKVIVAIKLLVDKFPDIKFILVGSGDEIEIIRVQQLIKKSGVERHVTIAGYVSSEELTNHFLLADVLVMPSTGEGFGITFIEAAACGCQSIAGNADGSTDALLNGKLGTLINPDSISELTNAIALAVLQKTKNYSKIQECCIEHFSFEQYKNKVYNLLK